MNDLNRKRLNVLKKKNRLGLALPNYQSKLVRIVPELAHAKILEIAQIEELDIRISGNNRETIVIERSPKRKPEVVHNTLKTLMPYLDAENFFSIDKLRELWVAQLNTKFIINQFENIIEIDEDLFVVHDKELKNGLWVDQNEEYWTSQNKTQYESVYELKVWGHKWTNLLLKHEKHQ